MGNQPQKFAYFLGEEKKGETKPLRNILIKEDEALPVSVYEGCYTQVQAMENNYKRDPNHPFLGTRQKLADGTYGDYEWMTYGEFEIASKALSRSFMKHGFCPVIQGPNVSLRFMGLYAKNRKEWLMSDFGCQYNDITSVCFYDTYGIDNVEFIIYQTELTTISCAGMYAKKLIELKKTSSKIDSLKNLITFDELTKEELKQAEEVGLQIFNIYDLIEEGKTIDTPLNFPTPDSIFTFCYTSGTTGEPKAAMISNKNLVSMVHGVLSTGIGDIMKQDDMHFSYLPLPHMFERVIHSTAISVNGKIAYYQGDITKLMDDLATVKPTTFCTVPRVLNRVYAGIQAKFNEVGFLKRQLINTAVSQKLKGLKSKGSLTHPLWDRLVFNKIKNLMGGRVKFMVTGSAPVSPDVMDFLKICFGCPITEGYGQTETTCGVTLQMISDASSGNVGGPMTCNELKLVDVPEMGYTVNDIKDGVVIPRGELCFRGTNVFSGYYKAPELTKEVFDEDGWLHSGDIGEILPNGSVRIIDRKKNIFKLAQGEYIAPEKIENVFAKSPFVSQIFVYGDSLQSYLIAIVVVEEKTIKKWAEQHNLHTVDVSELITRPELKKDIMDEFNRLGRAAKFNGLEFPKNIYVTNQLFTVENGLATPTQKIKRFEAKKAYLNIIKELYENGPKQNL